MPTLPRQVDTGKVPRLSSVSCKYKYSYNYSILESSRAFFHPSLLPLLLLPLLPCFPSYHLTRSFHSISIWSTFTSITNHHDNQTHISHDNFTFLLGLTITSYRDIFHRMLDLDSSYNMMIFGEIISSQSFRKNLSRIFLFRFGPFSLFHYSI